MSRPYLYPLPVRIWHWINTLIIITLTITGIELRILGSGLFLKYGHIVSLHKYLGFALLASYIFWFFYYLLSGGLKRYYFIHIKDVKGMPKQALFYIFYMFRGMKNPFTPSIDEKFNPLQKLTYLSVMLVLMPVIIITGIMFSDVLYFLNYIKIIGGLRVLDAIHVVTGYLFVVYLLVHIYMSTLGRRVFSHIKTMFTGYEEEKD